MPLKSSFFIAAYPNGRVVTATASASINQNEAPDYLKRGFTIVADGLVKVALGLDEECALEDKAWVKKAWEAYVDSSRLDLD